MTLNSIENWDMVRKRFEAWWQRSSIERPLLQVVAPKAPERPITPPEPPSSLEAMWLDADYRLAAYEHQLAHTHFAGDAFPFLDTHIGPGTLSLYLGAEPGYAENTVWYEKIFDDIATAEVPVFDESNRFFQATMELSKKGVEQLSGRAMVSFPDLIEGLDTIASLVGTNELLMYLMDKPEHVHRFQREMNDLYFAAFDRLYDVIKDEDGGSCFSFFRIYGYGKTAKVQCDFSAMISPDMFAEFVVPYLADQCARLDYSVFHLDGPCCIQHLDLLLGIKELDAIQWTPTTGTASACNEQWHDMYKKILAAGKSVMALGGTPEEAKKLVENCGPDGIDIVVGVATPDEADRLVEDSYKWGK